MTKRTVCIAVLSFLLMIAAVAAVSFAWLGLDENSIVTHVTGRLVSEYFHCGSGSEDDPFVITRPIHYYHMVEFFQRLTNLPVVVYGEQDRTIVKFGEEYLYFQIGCPEEQLYNPSARPVTDEQTQYYVYDYDSAGTLQMEPDPSGGVERGKKSRSLNMAYYSGNLALMPIGTSQIPFVGQLDGKGLTVTGLHIVSTSTAYVYQYDENGYQVGSPTEYERHTCDVGMFGYVGPYGIPHGEENLVQSSIKNIYVDGMTIELADLDSSAVTTILDEETGTYHTVSTTVHGETNPVCYAGYIAGHITLASMVENVYVNHATISGGNPAMIGYGYFGCVENPLGESIGTLGSMVADMRASGDNAGFGGSIDMKNIFERVNAVAASVRNTAIAYPTEEVVVINEETGQRFSYITQTSTGADYNSLRFRHYASTLGGSYYFNVANGISPYIYLTGYNEYQIKTVRTYKIVVDSDKEAFHISDAEGKHFLGVSSTIQPVDTIEANASRWNLTDWDDETHTGKLSTYIGDTLYYLTRNGTGLSLNADAETASEWTGNATSGEMELRTGSGSGGPIYYLIYEDGWKLTTSATTYVITDGNGHYIKAAASGIETETTPGTATEWSIVKPTATTMQFYTNELGETLYLALTADAGLTLSQEAFSWTYESELQEEEERLSFYTEIGGMRYYLAYDGGWAGVVLSGYSISDGEHYLSALRNLSGITEQQTVSYLSLWQLSDVQGPSTTISVCYNGARLYLSCDPETGLLLLSPEPMTWYPGENGIYYCLIHNVRNYLFYDPLSGWTTKASTIYVIQAGETANYLSVSLSTDGMNMVPANVSDAGEDGSFWKIDDSAGASVIYTIIGGESYYLCVENGVLAVRTPTEAVYDEVPGDNGELVSVLVLEAWDASDATVWEIDNLGRRYAVCNDTAYYLTFDGSAGTWGVGSIWYTIRYGTHYLMTDLGDTADGTLDLAKWNLSDPGVIGQTSGMTTIFTFAQGNPVYLGFDGLTLTLSSSPTEWVRDGNGFYVSIRGIKYYLTYEEGTGWTCLIGSYTEIRQRSNSRYLTVNAAGNGVLSSDVLTDRSKWQFEDGKLFVLESATAYYLNLDANDTHTLTVSADPETATLWTWDGTEESYYVTINGFDYYLTYDGGSWTARLLHYYTISSGTGTVHYMTLNAAGTGITDSTSVSDRSRWQMDGGHIFTIIDGDFYYVNLSGGLFSVGRTEGNATQWTNGGSSLSYQVSGDTAYDYHVYCIAYNGGWTIQDNHHGVVITDENGNYLAVNASTSSLENTGNLNEAARWIFSAYNGGTNPSGTLATKVNGETRYLSHDNDALSLSNNTSEWDNNGVNFTYTTEQSSGWFSGTTYTAHHYLVYEKGEWSISRTVQGFRISDGKNHYLGINPSTNPPTVSSVSEGNAPVWSGKEGYLSTIVDGLEFFLNCNGNGLYLSQSERSEWVLDGTYLKKYKESAFFGAVYLYYNIYYNAGNWTVSEDRTGFLSVTRGNHTNLTFTGNSEPLLSRTQEVHPALATVRIVSVTDAALADYVSVSGGIPEPEIAQNMAAIGIMPRYGEAEAANISTSITKGWEEIEPPVLFCPEVTKESFNIRLTETDGITITGPQTTNNVESGYPTYIPLRLELQDENDKTSYYTDYRVSDRNTGYIVSGAHQTSGNYRSDIRISRYNLNQIYRSLNVRNNANITYNDTYNNRLQVITRTASSGGYVRIKDSHNGSAAYNGDLPGTMMSVEDLGLTKYEFFGDMEGEDVLARNQLGDVLKGTQYIYGLHFMESTITKENTIYADLVTINGNTYYNYELPEDCIDCWLSERGSINFFAGTYYTYDVTSFFSLHQVIRNANNQITDIKELSKVYQSPRGVKDRYVYLYRDGSYSDGYSAVPEGYTEVFDLAWITNPGTIVQNAMYYFEVPVNAGEYALGSVEGKYGAYLIYLDIAANGGDTISQLVSGEGNELTDAYKVDYRTEPDKLEEGYYSILQFAISAPSVVNSSDFSVSVSFDGNPENLNYSKGLYTITVVNKSNENLELDVFLSDDDREPYNDFLYAYRIQYINNSHPAQTIILNAGEDYYQAMASFVIPGTGDAEESSYNS